MRVGPAVKTVCRGKVTIQNINQHKIVPLRSITFEKMVSYIIVMCT